MRRCWPPLHPHWACVGHPDCRSEHRREFEIFQARIKKLDRVLLSYGFNSYRLRVNKLELELELNNGLTAEFAVITQMVVHKTFSRGGRVKITVEQPPTQPALQPDRLEAENENLRSAPWLLMRPPRLLPSTVILLFPDLLCDVPVATGGR